MDLRLPNSNRSKSDDTSRDRCSGDLIALLVGKTPVCNMGFFFLSFLHSFLESGGKKDLHGVEDVTSSFP